jgi:Rrf2 family protein
MPRSGRFRVAVHVLTLLAHEKGRPLTSDFVAGSVNTNAVVIRRVLGLLSRAGLVSTAEGARGGTQLARPPEGITLAHAYAAVESESLFGESRSDPNPLCPVGRSVQEVLAAHVKRFERGLRSELETVTVADVLAGVRKANRTALPLTRRSR